jgi:hypothetical protein
MACEFIPGFIGNNGINAIIMFMSASPKRMGLPFKSIAGMLQSYRESNNCPYGKII